MELNITHLGDAEVITNSLPDKSLNCIVTSVPYYRLRDYKVKGQIGLENTPTQYIRKLVKVFRAAKAKLRDDGTLWINIGDTYYGGRTQPGGGGHNGKAMRSGTPPKKPKVKGMVPKNLIGIPWKLAFALQADGWILRQDIIWHKSNAMPESVVDRCTKAHEYIFLFSKKKKYYFDQESIMQDVTLATIARMSQDQDNQRGSDRAIGKENGPMKSVASWKGSSFTTGRTGEMAEEGRRLRSSGNKRRKNGSERDCPEGSGSNVCSSVPWEGFKANKRSVWTVATAKTSGDHYATFPEELIVDCIKAGCPVDGVVYDPFHGSGITGIVCTKLGRNYVAAELSPRFIHEENKLRYRELGMFAFNYKPAENGQSETGLQ